MGECYLQSFKTVDLEMTRMRKRVAIKAVEMK